MNSSFGRMTVALAVLGVGLAAWSEARSARRLADGYVQLATFRFDPGAPAAAPLLDRVAARVADPGDEPRYQQSMAQYWLGRYDLLAQSERSEVRSENDAVDDPDVLFVAANAAFRALGPIPAPNVTHVARLDYVLAGYAAVLKTDPDHSDAAYNYEFVSRLREVAARTAAPAPPKPDARSARQGTRPVEPPAPDPAPRLTVGDLPGGPTIHGRPGGPPPATRGEDFQVITPMEYGERESQPEASPGGKLPRKG
jgi:hypothetical protein